MTNQPEIIWTVERRGQSGWKTYPDEQSARKAAKVGTMLGCTVEIRKHVRGAPDHHIEVLDPAR